MLRVIRRRVLFELVLASLLAALLSCGGSDGAPGAAGPAGPPGPPGLPGTSNPPPDIGDATEINATITGVAIASPPVVQFQLTDGSGLGLVGLPADAISFTIAQLTPGADGNPSSWQDFVQRIESADGTEPDILAEATQATTENGATGVLVDNGDGTYQYTFALDITTAGDDPTLTHRVGFEIRGLAPVTNPVYTFRPSDGAITGIFTRDIVQTASCNGCHDQLSLHGGARFEVQYCVTCHNPGSTDQDSGNTVSFPVMIHKIHQGANLPSVLAGGDYSIYGFGEGQTDFSDVEFPQDVRNCRTCHDENDPATPDAKNWFEVPNVAACGACHDDVNFETGENHGPAQLAVSNADCVVCHRPGGLVGGVDESHALLEQQAAEAFQYNVLGVAGFAPGQTPAVTFSVTDPTNGDAPYDIENDAPFAQGDGASSLTVKLAWSTTDYSNTGSGSATVDSGTPAQPISISPLFGAAADNGDGTFTVTSALALPADLMGTGAVAIEGHPAADVNGDGEADRLPVTSAVEYFALTDPSPVARRQVVDLAKCQTCHQSLSLHGSNRTDNIYICVTCHNANATDINRREEAAADAADAGEIFEPADGKVEEAVHFKALIHGIHAGEMRQHPLVIYGFGGSENDFGDVVFPGTLSRCDTCHLDGTYYPVDDATTVLATTISTGADRTTPLDDVNVTPNAATCAACHDDELALAHIEQNGGAFDATQTADGTLISAAHGTVIETCSVCHGAGRLADVKVVHGF